MNICIVSRTWTCSPTPMFTHMCLVTRSAMHTQSRMCIIKVQLDGCRWRRGRGPCQRDIFDEEDKKELTEEEHFDDVFQEVQDTDLDSYIFTLWLWRHGQKKTELDWFEVLCCRGAFSSQIVAVVSGPSSWIKGRLIAFIEWSVRMHITFFFLLFFLVYFLFFLPSCLFVRFYSAVFLCCCWYCFCVVALVVTVFFVIVACNLANAWRVSRRESSAKLCVLSCKFALWFRFWSRKETLKCLALTGSSWLSFDSTLNIQKWMTV